MNRSAWRVILIALPGIFWSHPVIGQVTGEALLLRTIAERCAENDARIITWRGKAEIVDIDTDTESERVLSTRVAAVSFRYSRDGDRLFFDKRIRATEGDQPEKIYRYAGLRTRDAFYRYGPLAEDGDAGVAVRPLPLARESKGFRSENFDPLIFNKLKSGTRTVTEFTTFCFVNRDKENLLPTSVTSHDSLVEVTVEGKEKSPTTIRWKYQFNLNQAGLPVSVEGGSEAGNDAAAQWENSFVEIGAIWLPEKLVYRLNDRGQHRLQSRVTLFTEHQLNEKLDDSEFEVASLPMRAGDKVFDPATRAWSRFGAEEKKPDAPADVPVAPQERFSRKRMLLIINLAIGVALITIVARRKWLRSSRKK